MDEADIYIDSNSDHEDDPDVAASLRQMRCVVLEVGGVW
jgi:hypothetical protein